jgi:hypothetical protein
MSSEEFDERLAGALQTRAESTRTDGDPVPGVEARAKRIRRNRRVAAGIPAIIAVAAIGFAAAGAGMRETATPAVETTTSATVPDPSLTPSAAASNSTTPTSTDPATSSPADTAAPPASRDEALLAQLEADPDVAATMLGVPGTDKPILCAIDVVGADTSKTHLYAMVGCSGYTTGPDAHFTTSSSYPALLTVSGTGAGVRIESVELAHDKSLDADIDRMFPPNAAQILRGGNLPLQPTQDELLTRARAAGH